MKKNIFITAVLSACMVFASCNQDLLDIEPQSSIDLELLYKQASDDDADRLIAGIYRMAAQEGKHVYSDILLNSLSDDYWYGNDASSAVFIQIDDFTFGSTNEFISDTYSRFFQINYQCNLIVDKLVEDSDYKKRVKAEAKAVRAWAYINLIRYWGTPQLVDRVMSIEDVEKLPNGDPDALWAYVQTSLEEAIAEPNMPSKANKSGQGSIGGRLTKEACQALLGKALIYQEEWAAAATELKKVIDSGLYELISDPGALYTTAADFGTEYLWEANAKNDAPYQNHALQTQGTRANAIGWRNEEMRIADRFEQLGWGFGVPSKAFGDFLATFDVTSGGEKSARAKSLIVDWDDLYDPASGWTFGRSTPTTNGGSTGVLKKDFLTNCAGYFRVREVVVLGDKYTSSNRSMANVPFMRYAEALLMYAEAQVRKAGGDSDGTGLAALNEVRTRAGIPTLVGSYTLADVKNERRAELFHETERFADLVRWGDAATVLENEGKVRYRFYGYNTDGDTSSGWNVTTVSGTNSEGFKAGKHELLPFPQSEIYSNPLLEQNNEY